MEVVGDVVVLLVGSAEAEELDQPDNSFVSEVGDAEDTGWGACSVPVGDH
jgi:hypothetical protein